jgi:proteic killer suppression protein
MVDIVNYTIYSYVVIGSFRHKGLEELYRTGKTRRIDAGQTRKCARILQLLEIADRPEGLNIAGFHFHRLRGKPQRWSVGVTANYRITFAWLVDNAMEVDFEDYH